MDMPITNADKRASALEFLKNHKTGVLATISPDGMPRARLLYYSCDDAFNVSFLTLSTTRKVSDLSSNQSAAFTVAAEEIPQSLQMEGKISDLTDSGTIDASLSKLTEHWLSNTTFGAPLTRLDTEGIIKYYRFTPTWIRWEDFTSGQKASDIITDFVAN